MIDAVARLKDHNDNRWLLLVQVSLSWYARHRSKVADLLKSITWPEKENRADTVSWMKYYEVYVWVWDENYVCIHFS